MSPDFIMVTRPPKLRAAGRQSNLKYNCNYEESRQSWGDVIIYIDIFIEIASLAMTEVTTDCHDSIQS